MKNVFDIEELLRQLEDGCVCQSKNLAKGPRKCLHLVSTDILIL